METFFPIISKYILPGSVIVSDCWTAYNTLCEEGYKHWRINHSLNFVDPDDREVHTQNIERLWRDVKEFVRHPGICSAYLKQYIARYLLLKNVSQKLHLHTFLVEATKLYPHQCV